MFIKLLAAYLPTRLVQLHNLPCTPILDDLIGTDNVHARVETPLLVSPFTWRRTCPLCGVLILPLVYPQGRRIEAQHYHEHEHSGGIYIMQAEPQEAAQHYVFAAFEAIPDYNHVRLVGGFQDTATYSTPSVTLTRALWTGKCSQCNDDPDDFFILANGFIFGFCNKHSNDPVIAAPSPYLPVISSDGWLMWRMR